MLKPKHFYTEQYLFATALVLILFITLSARVMAQEKPWPSVRLSPRVIKGEDPSLKVSVNEFVQIETLTDSSHQFIYQIPADYTGEGWGESCIHFEPSLNFKDASSGRATAIGIDVYNPMSREVVLFVGLDSNPFDPSTRLSGIVRLPTRTESRIHLYFPTAYSAGSPKRLKGYPPLGGARPVWNVLSPSGFDEGKISLLLLSVKNPKSDTLQVQRIFFFNSDSLMRGMVDPYGQFALGTWEGKLPSTASKTEASRFLKQARERETKERARVSLPDQDAIGAWRRPVSFNKVQGNPGFFRVGMANGKWWFMAPSRSNHAKPFFSIGMNLVSATSSNFEVAYQLPQASSSPNTTERLEASFAALHQEIPAAMPGVTTDIPDLGYFPNIGCSMVNFYWQNCLLKYAPRKPEDLYQILPSIAYRRMQAWGFNTLGNWSNEFSPQSAVRKVKNRTGDQFVLPSRPIPYVMTLYSFIGAPPIRPDFFMPDVFHPAFAEHALRVFQNEITIKNGRNAAGNDVRNDPMNVGYFIDNELPWDITADGTNSFYLIKQIFSSASRSRNALLDTLQRRYGGSLEALAAAWKLPSVPLSWETVSFPSAISEAASKDFSDLTFVFARAYFSQVRTALHQVDRHHLYLGCRFATCTPEIIQASNEFCDVVSFNIYADSLSSWKRYRTLTAAQANGTLTKPIIIGEFHFGAEDRGLSGGLVNMNTTKGRAEAYQRFVESVSNEPQFVGCHWFQYADQSLTGRTDGENYNIGFIDVTDEPYKLLISAARKTHRLLYSRRLK